MSSLNELIHEAVAERDLSEIHSLIKNNEFILLSTAQDDQEGHEGAFIADIDGMEALMVFSSNEVAKQFVDESSDSISPDEEIDGIIIEGEALLDYLPAHYGILLDAECESALIIEPELVQQVKKFSEDKNGTDEEE